MISRTLVRTRVIQTLYAYYKDGDKTSLSAKKELLKSFSDSYDLYVLLLSLVNELTQYAEEQIEAAESRAKVMHEEYTANRRFVNNRLSQKVFNNRPIRNYLANNKLSWEAGMDAMGAIYKELTETDYYKEYMSAEKNTYEDDKRIWRKIYTELLPYNEALYSALDDMEVVLDRNNWTVDVDMMLTFAIKTLKRFEEEGNDDQEILPMFKQEEDLDFAKDLLRYAIEEKDRYEQLIDTHLRNWDASRVAYMDRIILQTALAELFHFDDIALEVTLNEYIELSKEYSTDKSYTFINGVLTEIMRDEKRQGTLMKAMGMRV
jgi:N utilization substance protein B